MIISPVYCATIIIMGLWKEEYINSDLIDKIDVCLMSYGSLILVVTWLNYIIQQKKIVNIINRLYSINNNLKSCNTYTFKSDCRMHVVFMVHFILCFVLFVCELFVRKIYAEVLWFAPFIISSWVLMQYTLLLIIISQLFESINVKIIKFEDLNRYQTINSKVLRQEFDIKDIYCINNAIMQLCDVCNQIADFYAIPTLLIIVYFITTTTYSIYYVILSVFLLKESDFMILSTVIGIWTFITVVDMVIVTLNVTRITREVSLNIHLRKILQILLLDLLRDVSYREVKFTTYGVITLDGSLLQTVIILLNFWNHGYLSNYSCPVS
ncbi:GSCOCT00014153001.2-RA-CDS, partial [Cotesia congregata]